MPSPLGVNPLVNKSRRREPPDMIKSPEVKDSGANAWPWVPPWLGRAARAHATGSPERQAGREPGSPGATDAPGHVSLPLPWERARGKNMAPTARGLGVKPGLRRDERFVNCPNVMPCRRGGGLAGPRRISPRTQLSALLIACDTSPTTCREAVGLAQLVPWCLCAGHKQVSRSPGSTNATSGHGG